MLPTILFNIQFHNDLQYGLLEIQAIPMLLLYTALWNSHKKNLNHQLIEHFSYYKLEET